MAIKYTWEITRIKTKKVGDKTDVVSEIEWVKKGVDKKGNHASYHGITPIEFNDSNDFTQFESLTEKQVIEWVKSYITDDIEKNINLSIENQIKANLESVEEKTIPWKK